MPPRAAIPAVLALALAACGGGGDGRPRVATPTATPSPEATVEPAAVDPADADVVRAWADTLRRGRVRAAARYFALPSLVANGTAPIRLRTRAQAEFFNRTLPCGAVLTGTEPGPRGFLIATFRLTERPGRGRCGSGTGETARTAFRVRDGRITDWLRAPDLPEPPATPS